MSNKIKLELEVDRLEWDSLLDSPENEDKSIPEVLDGILEELNESHKIPLEIWKIKLKV